jgi:hypothetical protein
MAMKVGWKLGENFCDVSALQYCKQVPKRAFNKCSPTKLMRRVMISLNAGWNLGGKLRYEHLHALQPSSHKINLGRVLISNKDRDM